VEELNQKIAKQMPAVTEEEAVPDDDEIF